MPCPSAGPKIVCAGPSFVRPKWFTYCFCAGLKDDLHLVNSVLEPPQKMFGAALKAIHFFCLAQYIRTGPRQGGIIFYDVPFYSSISLFQVVNFFMEK